MCDSHGESSPHFIATNFKSLNVDSDDIFVPEEHVLQANTPVYVGYKTCCSAFAVDALFGMLTAIVKTHKTLWFIVEKQYMPQITSTIDASSATLQGIPTHVVRVDKDNEMLSSEIKKFKEKAGSEWIIVMTDGKARKRNVDWFPVIFANVVLFPNRTSVDFYKKIGKHYLGGDLRPRPFAYELSKEIGIRKDAFRRYLGDPLYVEIVTHVELAESPPPTSTDEDENTPPRPTKKAAVVQDDDDEEEEEDDDDGLDAAAGISKNKITTAALPRS